MATITKRGKSYRIRAYAGYSIDGRQIERTKTWTPPAGMTERAAEREASRQAVLFEEAIRNGESCNGKIKFSDFANLWLHDYADRQLRPRTVARYKELLVKINQSIGYLPLERIRPTHLIEFYRDLEKTAPQNASYRCCVDLRLLLKERHNTQVAFATQVSISPATLSTAWHRKPISKASAEKICAGLNLPLCELFQPTAPEKVLSGTTIQHYHSLISDILGDAVQWQYIPYNPCSRVAPPKSTTPEINFLDEQQVVHMLELLKKEPAHYRRPIIALLLSGMRRGELLGLEWDDFDWENHHLTIARTSQYLSGRGVYTDKTKNAESCRTIPLSAQEIALYQEQFLWQRKQAALLEDKWKNSQRVFTYPDGSPMRPDRLSSWFKGFIRRTDLPQETHLHSLRHTCATLRITAGDAINTVARQLGHADATTTIKIYTHAVTAALAESSSKMGERFKDYL